MEDDKVGYRFHPSDEEIVLYYLASKLRGLDFSLVINEVDINEFEPWDLRDFAAIQSDDEWYFFTKPNYMDAKRIRINRKTKAGFWKVTCKDRPVKDKRGRVIGYKKTLAFHQGRHPGVRTKWKIHEFHYKDADKVYQRPFVLCRLKKKSDDGNEPSPPQLASNSGNYHNVNIVPQENHELSFDLQSFLNNDEQDNNSLSAVQFQLNTDQGTSCFNGFINEYDASRSQLDTREHEVDFVNSIWASDDEDQHIHEGQHLFEENVQTRLHDFKPEKPLSGYVAASSDLSVGRSCGAYASVVPQADKPKEPEKPMEKPKKMPMIISVARGNFSPVQQSGSRRDRPIVLQSDSSDSTIETTHEQGKVPKTLRMVAQNRQMANSAESYKEPWDKLKAPDMPKPVAEKPKMPLGRKGSYIYLETPAWSHTQYPPSVYMTNIVVALFLLVFFVREMVSLH